MRASASLQPSDRALSSAFPRAAVPTRYPARSAYSLARACAVYPGNSTSPATRSNAVGQTENKARSAGRASGRRRARSPAAVCYDVRADLLISSSSGMAAFGRTKQAIVGSESDYLGFLARIALKKWVGTALPTRGPPITSCSTVHRPSESIRGRNSGPLTTVTS